MLKITKVTDYAIVVLCCLVKKQVLLSASDVAKLVNLQPPTVSKVLKLLVKSNLVQSQRGIEGGYKLCVDPKTITVSHIVECLEGPIELTACSKLNKIEAVAASSCEHISDCQLSKPWQKINHAINTVLKSITLYELAYNQVNV